MVINPRAIHWLENLIARNYKTQIDLSTLDITSIKSLDLDSNVPNQLIYNITYLVNSGYEYGKTMEDQYGRFPFKDSLSNKLGIHQENLVHELILKLLESQNATLSDIPSKVILSHDIDTLHSGFIYEFYRGLRTLDIPLMMRVLISLMSKKSLWWNLDEILDLLDRYDFKSIFYFIVEQGWSEDHIKNADYEIKDPRIQAFIHKALDKSYEVGLHKSTLDISLEAEKTKLGDYCESNRYHFVHYRIPYLYEALSASSFVTDSSLIYPYNMGFRNSYGLPFEPLNLETGKTYDILEIPFQIMDGMFPNRTAKDSQKATKEVLDFLDKHRYNAVLGILWHNTDLNEVGKKHSLELFKNLLQYIYESKIEVVTPSQVYAEYNG